MAKRKPLTEEEKEIIAKYYPIRTPAEVAEMVGMTKGSIITYAHRNNISNNRYWTEAEEEYLMSKYGVMTAEAIAKKLGRTSQAVKDKLKRIQLGSFVSNVNGLCISEVSRLVGRDRAGIKRTWIKHGLKTYRKGQYLIIKEKDLANFMKNNPDRWDATECETWFFEKYDWFRKKRIEDRNKMCERRWG